MTQHPLRIVVNTANGVVEIRGLVDFSLLSILFVLLARANGSYIGINGVLLEFNTNSDASSKVYGSEKLLLNSKLTAFRGYPRSKSGAKGVIISRV